MPTDYRIILMTAALTLGNLAICIHRSSRVYLYQQTICLGYYMTNDLTKVNGDSTIDENLCKIEDVQSPLSIVEGVDSFLILSPGKDTIRFRVTMCKTI